MSSTQRIKPDNVSVNGVKDKADMLDVQKDKSPSTFTHHFPILRWLPSYSPAQLTGDILAGIGIGCLLIPQAIAYSSVARLPPSYGLASAMVCK